MSIKYNLPQKAVVSDEQGPVAQVEMSHDGYVMVQVTARVMMPAQAIELSEALSVLASRTLEAGE